MVTLIDLPFELLERIATFTIAAEGVPRVMRSILRLRLVHPAFGSAFLSALFQDFDCRFRPGDYEVQNCPLALSHMKTIASIKSITHFTKKLSLTSEFDVRLDCISGFPGLNTLPSSAYHANGSACRLPKALSCRISQLSRSNASMPRGKTDSSKLYRPHVRIYDKSM